MQTNSDFQQIIGRFDCELSYERHCTNENVKYVENPYEADVNDNHGVMVWACPACLQELSDDI